MPLCTRALSFAYPRYRVQAVVAGVAVIESPLRTDLATDSGSSVTDFEPGSTAATSTVATFALRPETPLPRSAHRSAPGATATSPRRILIHIA